MVRRFFAVSVTVALLGAAFFPASAQEENNNGFGVDLENRHLDVLVGGVDSPFLTYSWTSLDPCFLVSLRVNPNLFIEPAFGFYRVSWEEKNTGITPNQTDKETVRDLKLGIRMLYQTNPDAFVSPFVRGVVDIHFLKNTEENDATILLPGITKIEESGTAFVIAGSIGGIISIRDAVFVTVEGRLLWGYVGDTDIERGGPSATGFQDQRDTSSSLTTTDMVVGLRVLCF
jgi:hypothetical protein